MKLHCSGLYSRDFSSVRSVSFRQDIWHMWITLDDQNHVILSLTSWDDSSLKSMPHYPLCHNMLVVMTCAAIYLGFTFIIQIQSNKTPTTKSTQTKPTRTLQLNTVTHCDETYMHFWLSMTCTIQCFFATAHLRLRLRFNSHTGSEMCCSYT